MAQLCNLACVPFRCLIVLTPKTAKRADQAQRRRLLRWLAAVLAPLTGHWRSAGADGDPTRASVRCQWTVPPCVAAPSSAYCMKHQYHALRPLPCLLRQTQPLMVAPSQGCACWTKCASRFAICTTAYGQSRRMSIGFAPTVRVNDFSAPGFMNLLCVAVLIAGWRSPVAAG